MGLCSDPFYFVADANSNPDIYFGRVGLERKKNFYGCDGVRKPSLKLNGYRVQKLFKTAPKILKFIFFLFSFCLKVPSLKAC